jgi:hypothetical protein
LVIGQKPRMGSFRTTGLPPADDFLSSSESLGRLHSPHPQRRICPRWHWAYRTPRVLSVGLYGAADRFAGATSPWRCLVVVTLLSVWRMSMKRQEHSRGLHSASCMSPVRQRTPTDRSARRVQSVIRHDGLPAQARQCATMRWPASSRRVQPRESRYSSSGTAILRVVPSA